MKKIFTVLFAITVAISISFGQSKSEKEKAFQIGMKAIKLMDEGDFDKAIELLKEAEKLDPERIDYPYEIAYALYSQKKYKKAIKQLKKNINHQNVTDQHFQLLGNCYDILNKPDEALKIYKQGLEKFPNSGKLYLEQGIVESFRENYDDAIEYWEKGVEVDPDFSSNYYWLGKIFSFSEERVWAVLYGEVFVNLERNTKRTIEMSEILFNTYKQSINVTSDTSGGVSFSKVMTIDPSKEFKLPFQMVYGLTMTMSLAFEMINNEPEISISSINSMRQQFISNWFDQKRDEDYPNLLFDFQKLLKEKGHFEAYNYWLLMKGNEVEFGKWYEANKAKFDAFADWFNENPLIVNEQNYFSRQKY
jgi:tetratricopeptide (TPR) repeat protein